MMLSEILFHFDLVLVVQSLVLFVELLINLKRSGPIKFLLLFCAVTLVFRNFGRFYFDYQGYNRWLMELPPTLLVLVSLIFFSYLYQHQIKKYVISFLGLILLWQIVILLSATFIFQIDESVSSINITKFKLARVVIRGLFIVGMFWVFIDLLKKISKKYQSQNLYHYKIRRWSFLFAIHLITVFTLGIFQSYLGIENFTLRIAGAIVSFSFIHTLLFRPKFLNNSSLKAVQGTLFNMPTVKEISMAQFTDAFFYQMYFLKSDASIDDLSLELNIEPDDLYRFIYSNFQTGFNDLVNSNRITYFTDLVKSKKFPLYTIDALAKESGFTSRHHLYRPFKKFHGGNPSDFIRSLE